MGDLIQFRPRTNTKADRAFWMGPDRSHAGSLPYRDENGIWHHGPDDLTMSRPDPEMVYEAPDGDCA